MTENATTYNPIRQAGESLHAAATFKNPLLKLIVRVTWAFSLGIVGALTFCFQMSLFFQAVFVVFTDNFRGFRFVGLFVIPIMIFALQFLLSQQVNLFSDVVDPNVLPQFQAWLLFACNKDESFLPIIQKWIAGTWAVFTFIPFIIVLLAIIWSGQVADIQESMPCLWLINVGGGLLVLLVFIVVKFVVFSRGRVVHRCPSMARLASSSLEIKREEYEIMLNVEALDSNKGQRRWFWALVACVVLLAIDATCVAYRPFGYNDVIKVTGGIYSIMLYACIAVLIMKSLPTHFDARTFPFFVAITFLFLIPMFVGFAYDVMNAGSLDQNPIFFSPPSRDVEEFTSDSGLAYPVCSLRWGHTNVSRDRRLHVLDMFAFAQAVYYSTDELAMKSVRAATEGTSIGTGVKILNATAASVIGHPVMFEGPEAKTCVLAIRGTHTYEDSAANADMWAAVKAMSLVNGFIPILAILPKKVVQQFANLFDMKTWLGAGQVWDDVVAFAKENLQKCDAKGFHVVVTGHSLGGGLAQIVAGHLSVPAVTWSPVGVKYSLLHFGLDEIALMRNVVNIVPQSDIVPEIDGQIGITQNIACTSSSRLVCHFLARSACEVLLSCGDPRNRRHSSGKSTIEYCKEIFGLEGGKDNGIQPPPVAAWGGDVVSPLSV